jgi:hypothetical protein
MKRLILFATALVIARGTAAAYAQGDHGASKYMQLASYHRVHHGHSYGYGRMDDPSAEGRTSG